MGTSDSGPNATNYDVSYFAARSQDRDRPALWFYERVIRRWVKPGKILDYGCGTGFMLKRLARYYDIAGFDVSADARQFTSSTVPGVTVYSSEQDIPEGCFSGIISLHVLEHIEHSTIPSVLSLWHNALITGGRVLCVVPDFTGRAHNLAGKRWNGFGDPTHVTLLGCNEWLQLFTSAGFAVQRVGTDGLWNPPYRGGVGKILDGLRFSLPALLQFLLGRLILPAGSGESAVFLLMKR